MSQAVMELFASSIQMECFDFTQFPLVVTSYETSTISKPGN